MGTTRPVTVLDAPSNLGLQPPRPGGLPGVAKLADTLRAEGIVARLGAVDAGRVGPPAYSPDIDPRVGIRNWRSIRRYSRDLARQLRLQLDGGRFPLVLGGDCSILLGTMLALRQMGRYGLIFIDGHTDFQTPATSRTGGAAGMDLALATGYGPAELASLADGGALVREADAVLFGHRDITDPDRYYAPEIFATAIQRWPLERLRQHGIDRAAGAVVAALQNQNVDGYWIHLDADVLDDGIMPAVDSRQPGGLSLDELQAALRLFLPSELAVGMEVTIFDPELDPDGTIARDFTTALVGAFR